MKQEPKITVIAADPKNMTGSQVVKAITGKDIQDLAYEIAMNKDGEYDFLYSESEAVS